MSDYSFSKKRDGTYQLDKYDGTSSVLSIPAEYEGKPVFFDDTHKCVFYNLDDIYGGAVEDRLPHHEQPYLWEYSVKDLRKSPWIDTKGKSRAAHKSNDCHKSVATR